MEGFIEKLGLSHLTLVIQDWGSVLGFHYAMRHESNIKGLAFMEAGLKPLKWEDFARDFKMAFRLFRTPGIGWLMISVMNMLVRQILPQATVRTLSAEEMKLLCGSLQNHSQPQTVTTVAVRNPHRRQTGGRP